MCDAQLMQASAKPLKRPSSSGPEENQAKPKRARHGRGELQVCGWLKNDGSQCTHEAASGDITAHRKSAGYHSVARAKLAVQSSVQQQLRQPKLQFGQSRTPGVGPLDEPSSSAPSTEPKPADDATPSETRPHEPHESGEPLNAHVMLDTLVQGMLQMKVSFDKAEEQMRTQARDQSILSRPVREEMIAAAVVRTLDAREREQAKSAQERLAEEAKSRTQKKLEAGTNIGQLCNAGGCFIYDPSNTEVFCTHCTPFIKGEDDSMRIPSEMVGHLNYNKFGRFSADLGDGSKDYVAKRLRALRQNITSHLNCRGHNWVVENKAILNAKRSAKQKAGLNVAFTAYECFLEARSSQVL